MVGGRHGHAGAEGAAAPVLRRNAGDSDLDTSGGAGHFDLAVAEGVAGRTFTVALVKTQFFQDGVGADDHVWDMNAASVAPTSLTFTSSNYGDYTLNSNGDYVWAGTGEGDYSYQAIDSSEPVGGTSNSVTGGYVTIDDDEGGSCGGV